MSGPFVYRPKFVDVRVRKPPPEQRRRAPRERACDHVGCEQAGDCKAPKSRDRPDEYWWFCQDHAAQYNRRWNYFAGMSEEEYAAFARAAEVGHRPTWRFDARTAGPTEAMRNHQDGIRDDKFGLFGRRGAKGGTRGQPYEGPERRYSRLESKALEVLALDEEGVTSGAIRARYAELVKRYHPDSNGGDRSMEGLLDKVMKAYQILKQGGHT